jgi:hypothetical protein
MASEPIRDPVKDHLLTPKNSAFIIIDYQLVQVNSVASMDRRRLTGCSQRRRDRTIAVGSRLAQARSSAVTRRSAWRMRC